LIATDAGRVPDGSWHALQEWDGLRLMTLFRERLLARLVESRAISKELVARLLAWRHPGFSAHVGERIAPEDKQRLLDTTAYLVRNPGPLCVRCGQRMSMVAFVTDAFAIRRILDHLWLSTLEAERRPLREALRVAEPAEGWGAPAEWE
jgi:hypothetical protein